MACDISAGRDEVCKDGLGGLRKIYIVNYDSSYFENKTVTSDEITAISTLPASANAYEFELRSDNNTLEETNEQSRDNGTSFWTQTLTVNLKKQSKESQAQLKLLSYGRPHVIVEDSNGLYRLLGFQNGMEVSVNTMTGGALGDMSGYSLTFEGKELNPAYFVADSLINSYNSSSNDNPLAGKFNIDTNPNEKM